MARTPLLLATLLALAVLPLLPAHAANPCPDEPVHTYHAYVPGRNAEKTAFSTSPTWTGTVVVSDTNAADCNDGGYGGPDGAPGDWDGDYDVGVGGGAFGYGAWAEDPDCNYNLNVHGPNVVVNDVIFGGNIWFLVGEDDQSGPIKIQNLVGGWTCMTSGTITPGDPATDPTADADDCLSAVYVGTGATCGTGGGDGMFWVFFPYMLDCEVGAELLPFCRVNPNETGGSEAIVSLGNPAVAGTITAF